MLTWPDLESMVATREPESQTLEFKQGLPTRKGDPDPWEAGDGTIPDRARNELLAEVCAFANADGGRLLLGVEETEETPGRAKQLVGVRDAGDLAARIGLQIRDCIEPAVLGVRCYDVAPEGPTRGVVVIEVPSSLAAPHRVAAKNTPRDAYVRRADRTETMTMRDIQDLVILRRTATEILEQRVTSARNRWDTQVSQHHSAHPNNHIVGIYALVVPLSGGPLLREVDEVKALFQPMHCPHIKWKNLSHPAQFPGMGWTWSPILGGLRSTSGRGSEDLLERDVLRDGGVEYRFIASMPPGAECALYPNWFAVLAYNATRDALAAASTAGRPSTEFALAVGIRCIGGWLHLKPSSGHEMVIAPRIIQPTPLTLPPTGFRDEESAKKAITYLLRDIHNAAGVNFDLESSGIEDPRE